MIIGITGKIGSGKTTISKYMEEIGYQEYQFAKPLKDIAKIFGYTEIQVNGSQSDKLEPHPLWKVPAREFLQKLGTDIFRDKLHEIIPAMKIETSIWVDIFRHQITQNPGNKNWVVSDVRFEDEADAIRSMGGVIIRVQKKDQKTSGGHISETSMDLIKADYNIENSNITLGELRDIVQMIGRQLMHL
jgi:energy-coupling factor transporter ATP-binding protein EcfA2